jgi:ribosomal protein S6--L-glutamate ligase
MKNKKQLIGRQEWCSLPELGLSHIKAKIDTGAKTSALHAEDITVLTKGHKQVVCFLVRPFPDEDDHASKCNVPLKEIREIKSSNGDIESRCVIEVELIMGAVKKTIELTLTDRNLMRFNLLLGREALSGEVVIDPAKKYLLGNLWEENK